MRSLILAAATLVCSLVFVFAYPDVAVKPGPLTPGHASLNRDCLRCHSMFHGATVENCTSCHKLAEIGRVSTTGVPLPSTGRRKVQFHQSLGNTDCWACHVVHATPRARKSTPQFQHAFLAADVRTQCGSCHLEQRPKDSLHQQVSEQCATCHATAGWRPATFEHEKFFRFDRNHSSRCDTCHSTANFKEYSCYGCHEHSRDRIAEGHREDGISNLDDCARCHRTGNADDAEDKGGEGEDRD